MIKWKIVFIFIFWVLVVNLFQINEILQKNKVELEAKKIENKIQITQLIEEKEEMDKERVKINEEKTKAVHYIKILEDELATKEKKLVKIEKVYKMGCDELGELTIEKMSDNGDSSEIEIILRDKWYYYPEKRIWDKIIKADDTEKNIHVTDKFDCGNFAHTFCSNLSGSYLLNSAGKVSGKSIEINKKTGRHDGHAWNIILVKENGKDNLYFFSPQTDEISPVGAEISVEGKTFKVTTIEWY